MNDRALIFISHANPEENELVLWLAGRLASAGYTVWSDVTRLIGGELFWERIENAIRENSAIFVSLVSRRSVRKRNFLNELSVAISVEVDRAMDDFVVPLRVDDMPFGNVPAQLHRKNFIDFHAGWDKGLAALLAKLSSLGVPKASPESYEQVKPWLDHHFGFMKGVAPEQEEVITNWLACRRIPESVFVAQLPPDTNVPALFDSNAWPIVKFRDHIVSFARANELGTNIRFGASAQVSIEALVSGDARFLKGAAPTAGRGVVSNLIRRAWERHARAAGLEPYRMASRRAAWFLPLSGAEIAWVDYAALTGEKRRKRLIGKSEKRNVFWHAALELIPLFQPEVRVALSMHVVFTTDGTKPVGDAALMHRLRRRFCKNWWQGQWRDLELAYLSYLSRGQSTIALAVSPDHAIELSAQPMRISVPVTHMEVAEAVESPLDVDELSDEVDDLDVLFADELNDLAEPAAPLPGLFQE